MNKLRKNKTFLFLIIQCACLIVILSCNSKSKSAEIYRGDSKVSIEAKYMGWACGSLTPQVMPVDDFSGISKEKLEYGFTFYTVDGLETPDKVEDICVPHNIFKITGYFYYTVENGKKYLHPRFDLISWHPIAPFNKCGANAKKIESRDHKRYEYKTKEPVNDRDFTKARKYDPC